ncbi:aminoglycoside 6'-N-acetyltransferase [Cohnella faecalis]|uniref:Aminoglycoside N(6')-acetyltransferase type 1 n=1 Tax=Cohnella faecalis TaxID=2315694 RepID=A0A398CMJ8_9BACL|nr:aminoglycoside 6'-N-acetyltransferase [Cohnella faecalis]RIE03512.1 GNAT family N-acetyltransferase [Cohnella faecalis]
MRSIIEANEQFIDELVSMALDLWPENDFENLKADFLINLHSEKNKVLLFSIGSEAVAFIHLSIRSDYVEGSEFSPTGYVEGIYVKPDYRRMGISRMLLNAGELWLRDKGCKQIGSDISIDNRISYKFHTSIGFKEAGRVIAFIKSLE